MAHAGEVISQLKHPVIVEARRKVASPDTRKSGACLVDGVKMVTQALDAGVAIQSVFLLHPFGGREEEGLFERSRHARIPTHLVSKGVFFRLLGLGYETSVSALAIITPRLCAPGTLAERASHGCCLLVGESIQDPRNVGVLIRAADGFGLAGAAFTTDSADPYTRAAIRSSTGSAFRVALEAPADAPSYLQSLRARGIRVIGTSAQAATPCWDAPLTGPCAIVLGNETAGLSPATREACDILVAIPMSGGAHSFNVTVAGGILMYERARQATRGVTGT